ncbi:MAG TPA: MtrB/PioB family decaheme-associated outer membrane protein [Steroidobacteraceae bacterium]|nr:MtrB/PioB family decaheme-associated outer membrane protein [Steroidobacteraceae bacterium]
MSKRRQRRGAATAGDAGRAVHVARFAAALAAALASMLASADPPAQPPPPDTSNWKCTQCPFYQGARGEAHAGVSYADGADAYSGRYTGINHSGAYADAGASGAWRDQGGTYLDYQLDDLGLPDRDASVNLGKEGLYDFQLGYAGQPTYLYDATATPFRLSGPGVLTLPSGFTPGATTAAMPQLAQSLSPVNVEFDRRTLSLLGKLYSGRSWTMYVRLSHQEKEGTDLIGASFLTDALELPEPIDYVTNDIETGALWEGRIGSVHLAYRGSWFQDDTDSLTFQNPYTSLVATDTGRMALPPGNSAQEGSLSGEFRLPVFEATTLSYSASLGRLSQSAAFLPVSTLPGATVPAPGELNGDVRLSHYALALSSRPASRLYLRGTASYDGRDDHTPMLDIPYVVTDELPGGTFITPRYGEDRTRLDGSADYWLSGWLRAGLGGQYLDTHFSPGQVITNLDDLRAWGHVTLTPLERFSLDLKGGSARRDASAFDVAALPPDENPLLRAYDYAPRDEEFYTVSGSWTLSAAWSWSLAGTWTDDAYRLSQLGLQESRDRQLSSTLTWVPTEKVNLYLDGGYQRLAALQNGMLDLPEAPLWQVSDAQYFWTLGLGGHFNLGERWQLGADYVHASTRGTDTTIVSAAAAPFPDLRSGLDSVSVDATYRWTEALKLRLRYGYASFDSNDWALGGVGFDTVPNLLTLGQQPYQYRVNIVSLSAIYRFDTSKPPPAQ